MCGRGLRWPRDVHWMWWMRSALGGWVQWCVGGGYAGHGMYTECGGWGLLSEDGYSDVWEGATLAMGCTLNVVDEVCSRRMGTVMCGRGLRWPRDVHWMWWMRSALGGWVQWCVGGGYAGHGMYIECGGWSLLSEDGYSDVWEGATLATGCTLNVVDEVCSRRVGTVMCGRGLRWLRVVHWMWWMRSALGGWVQWCVGGGYAGYGLYTECGGWGLLWEGGYSDVWEGATLVTGCTLNVVDEVCSGRVGTVMCGRGPRWPRVVHWMWWMRSALGGWVQWCVGGGYAGYGMYTECGGWGLLWEGRYSDVWEGATLATGCTLNVVDEVFSGRVGTVMCGRGPGWPRVVHWMWWMRSALGGWVQWCVGGGHAGHGLYTECGGWGLLWVGGYSDVWEGATLATGCTLNVVDEVCSGRVGTVMCGRGPRWPRVVHWMWWMRSALGGWVQWCMGGGHAGHGMHTECGGWGLLWEGRYSDVWEGATLATGCTLNVVDEVCSGRVGTVMCGRGPRWPRVVHWMWWMRSALGGWVQWCLGGGHAGHGMYTECGGWGLLWEGGYNWALGQYKDVVLPVGNLFVETRWSYGRLIATMEIAILLRWHLSLYWVSPQVLSHWGRDKIAAIWRQHFSRLLYEIVVFWFRFHWNLFPWVKLAICQLWFSL